MSKADAIKKVYSDSRNLLWQPVEVLVKEVGTVVNVNRYYLSLKINENPPSYVAIYRKKIVKLKRLRKNE